MLTVGDALRLYTACKLQKPSPDYHASIWNVAQQILKPVKAHKKYVSNFFICVRVVFNYFVIVLF